MLPSPSRLSECLDLARVGRFADAADLAGLGVAEAPSDGQLWQLCGLLRHKLGQAGAALNALEVASSLVPLAPASRCALAECYAGFGKAELARDVYVSLCHDESCPTDLLPNVASGLGSLGENGEALDACLELLRRDPSNHQAHFGFAFYLRRMGRPAPAMLPMVTRAHEIAPRVPLYRITLASLLHNVGKTGEAYELLLRVDPSEYRCRCCLDRAVAIFRDHGDVEGAQALKNLM